MKFFLVFLLCALAFILLFYFYPAQIFETIVSGNGTEVTIDLSLKSILFKEDLPEQLNTNNIETIRPTLAGYMILMVCLLGLPLMIAYRFSMNKKQEQNQSEENKK